MNRNCNMLDRISSPENLREWVEDYDLAGKLSETNKLVIFDREDACMPSATFTYAGQVVAFRKLGKIAFAKILSTFGAIQVILSVNALGDEKYRSLVNSDIKLGTHVEIHGLPAITSTKEPSLYAEQVTILQQSRSPFPDKWNGVSDEEKYRLRYQECLVKSDVHSLMIKRSKFIKTIRKFLDNNDFLEVETPILHKVSAGAQARPFVTECNALEHKDFYLRIAPETYLKRMTAAGYHRVYEIGKQFRNEGIDSSHMPEFTSLEYYCAYSNANDQIGMFVDLVQYILRDFYNDELEAFCESPTIYEYEDLYNKYVPNNLLLADTPENQIDANFKKYVRPNLDKPVIVTKYPAFLAPLAKRDPKNPKFVEMWQFIWKTYEVVKCYSELVDPVEQRKLLEEQATARENGDNEAMMIDENFLQTMEFGMPEQAGLGLGIDRLFALFMNISDIRDVTFFPPGT